MLGDSPRALGTTSRGAEIGLKETDMLSLLRDLGVPLVLLPFRTPPEYPIKLGCADAEMVFLHTGIRRNTRRVRGARLFRLELTL